MKYIKKGNGLQLKNDNLQLFALSFILPHIDPKQDIPSERIYDTVPHWPFP